MRAVILPSKKKLPYKLKVVFWLFGKIYTLHPNKFGDTDLIGNSSEPLLLWGSVKFSYQIEIQDVKFLLLVAMNGITSFISAPDKRLQGDV